MPDALPDLDHAVFAKTTLGQQEIQSRALGLGMMTRRLLILIDGKRSALELTPMVGGQDLRALLAELSDKGCIERSNATHIPTPPEAAAQTAKPTVPVAAPRPTSVPAPVPEAGAGSGDLSSLPAPETRSATDVTMARNFMTNTVNTIFQPYTRLTLLEAIAHCKTAQDARKVYSLWSETIGSSAIGAKRLPEFREKLFKVL